MTIQRGNFKMVCDFPNCTEEVDLETEDFREAISSKHDHEGWKHYSGRTGFSDYCPDHDHMSNR